MQKLRRDATDESIEISHRIMVGVYQMKQRIFILFARL